MKTSPKIESLKDQVYDLDAEGLIEILSVIESRLEATLEMAKEYAESPYDLTQLKAKAFTLSRSAGSIRKLIKEFGQ